MSILTKLFGSSPKEEANGTQILWKALTRMEQIESIKQVSWEKPVAIFKHSTRCGISRMVLKQFEKNFQLDSESMDIYFLDLLNYREISSEVSVSFQLLHQSPQLLVIKNGEAVAFASHYEINNINLDKFVVD